MSLLNPLLVAALMALALPSIAGAAIACVFVPPVMTVDASGASAPLRVVRSGDAVLMFEGEELIACGSPGATAESLERVVVDAGTVFIVDLSGGTMPGVVFDLDLGAGLVDRLVIVGTAGPDRFDIGSRSVDLDPGVPGASPSDVLYAGVERVQVLAGEGSDEVDATAVTTPLLLDGGPGEDSLTAGTRSDLVVGGDGADRLRGLAGADTLLGGAGPDVLEGGTGDDYLAGGPGDDVEEAGDGDDVLDQDVEANGGDALVAGEGRDTIAYDRRRGDLVISPGDAAFDGEAGENDLLTGDFDILLAGSGDDVLTGTAGPDVLWGGAGADTLTGGDGDDAIAGGAGDDAIDGGAGEDAVSHPEATGPVTVDLAAGEATGEGTDALAGFEHADGGPFGDTLIGDGGPNRLNGRAGGDHLVGGGGDDLLSGGGGADLAVFAEADGPVDVDLEAGTASGAGVDTLLSVEGAEGSAHDDLLVGSAADNVLVGGDGADTLAGRRGRDVLLGGEGADSMDGGPGRDRCPGRQPDDVVRRCER